MGARQTMAGEFCVVLLIGFVVTGAHAGGLDAASFLAKGEANRAASALPRRTAAVDAEISPFTCSDDACVAYLKHRVHSHDTAVDEHLRECCKHQWKEIRHGTTW